MSKYRIYAVDKKGVKIGSWGGSIGAKDERQAIKRFKILAGTTTAGIALAMVKAKRGSWKAEEYGVSTGALKRIKA